MSKVKKKIVINKADKQSVTSANNDWMALVTALLVIAAMFLLIFATTTNGGFAELYRSNVYVLLQGSIGRLTGAVPFSVAEVLCIIIPFFILYDLYDILKTWRKYSARVREAKHISNGTTWTQDDSNSDKAELTTARNRFGGFLKRLMLLAALLFFLYEACCGVNYHSQPFVSPDVYESASFTIDQLAEFCEYTSDKLQEIYAVYPDSPAPDGSLAAGDDADSDVPPYPEWSGIAEGAVQAMEALGTEYPQLSGYYPHPKKLSILSGLFSGMGVSGIYSPFTIEANVNGQMEGMEKPFTACHELSHLRGYMNEGEANYIGWLACIGSEDADFNRSGWLIAWIYAGRSLRRVDPERFDEIRSRLPEAAIAEITANNEFWAEHETRASEVQNKVNDAYLKSNGVDEGIDSYGQLTTLMLSWYFADPYAATK